MTRQGSHSPSTGSQVLSKKRKSPGSSLDTSVSPRLADGPKKVKLSPNHAEQQLQGSPEQNGLYGSDISLLPAEIWHHIFTFCPPKSLGNLLRVNKLFNFYLNPSSSFHRELPIFEIRSYLTPLKPNAIWQASRRLFWPHMPAPLGSKTELAMWQLACSRKCQNCDKVEARERASPSSPCPGKDGVVIVWSFGIRMCASCLVQQSVKVSYLLLRYRSLSKLACRKST